MTQTQPFTPEAAYAPVSNRGHSRSVLNTVADPETGPAHAL